MQYSLNMRLNKKSKHTFTSNEWNHSKRVTFSLQENESPFNPSKSEKSYERKFSGVKLPHLWKHLHSFSKIYSKRVNCDSFKSKMSLFGHEIHSVGVKCHSFWVTFTSGVNEGRFTRFAHSFTFSEYITKLLFSMKLKTSVQLTYLVYLPYL